VFDLDRALRAGFHAEGSFDRYDFGLTWNQALEGAGLVVGRRVDLHMDVEAVRQAADPGATPDATPRTTATHGSRGGG
jgi:polyisoprenoid-binding protein YceI